MPNNSGFFKRFELEEFPQPEIVKLKYPVFMCHGFGGLVAVMKSAPLYDPCMLVRQHGVIAIAPNTVPYAKIETRAENWVRLIQQFCREYSFEKVNVIAHSMGGLDMRFALSKLNVADKVDSLTTVSSPHHGSSLADLILKAPNLITEKLSGLFDWFGDSIYTKTKSDVLGSLEQLTCAYVKERFNPENHDVESVKYYSYSAAAGRGTDVSLNPVLKFQNSQIYEREGINDAFVSVDSAKWGNHIKTTSLSHLVQMHLQVNKENEKLYEDFWLDVLKMLKENNH